MAEGSRPSLWMRARRQAHNMVEGAVDTWFEYTLLIVIALNVVLLIASTVVVDPDSEWCVICTANIQ